MTVFYCHELGHLIAVCTAIQRKNKAKKKEKKETGLIKTASPSEMLFEPDKNPDTEVDSHFKPFMFVSLTGDGKNEVLATTVRDRVAYH